MLFVDFSGTQKRILGFQWYAIAHTRISMVRNAAYEDFRTTQYRKLGVQWNAVTHDKVSVVRNNVY